MPALAKGHCQYVLHCMRAVLFGLVQACADIWLGPAVGADDEYEIVAGTARMSSDDFTVSGSENVRFKQPWLT